MNEGSGAQCAPWDQQAGTDAASQRSAAPLNPLEERGASCAGMEQDAWQIKGNAGTRISERPGHPRFAPSIKL
jgi:hypothetical protein